MVGVAEVDEEEGEEEAGVGGAAVGWDCCASFSGMERVG